MHTRRARGAALLALPFLLASCSGPSPEASSTTAAGPASSSSVAEASPSAADSTAASSAAASTAASPAAASSRRADPAGQELVRATTDQADFEGVTTPPTLLEDLRRGGHVIVFRYTGSGGPDTEVPAELRGQIKDDGQRISEPSDERMRAYGQAYADQGIPVSRVLSSEYFFVWQHAAAAFGEPIGISRGLTGSLDFSDPQELESSLQALRDRTVTPPDAGSNTVLFTHQGKFDKAYGYYPDAGTTIVFRPDGSGTPQLVAVLSYEEFMALAG